MPIAQTIRDMFGVCCWIISKYYQIVYTVLLKKQNNKLTKKHSHIDLFVTFPFLSQLAKVATDRPSTVYVYII